MLEHIYLKLLIENSFVIYPKKTPIKSGITDIFVNGDNDNTDIEKGDISLLIPIFAVTKPTNADNMYFNIKENAFSILLTIDFSITSSNIIDYKEVKMNIVSVIEKNKKIRIECDTYF